MCGHLWVAPKSLLNLTKRSIRLRAVSRGSFRSSARPESGNRAYWLSSLAAGRAEAVWYSTDARLSSNKTFRSA